MVLLNNCDRIMIGKICGNMYAAFYSITHNASMVMNIIITSINSSFNPWLYQKLSEKEYGKIKEVSRYLLIIVAGVSIIPIIFAPEIIVILGSDEYFSAVSIMPIFSCCVFLIYVYTLFSNVEMFFEKPKYTMYGSVSATVINIVLNYFFYQENWISGGCIYHIDLLHITFYFSLLYHEIYLQNRSDKSANI